MTSALPYRLLSGTAFGLLLFLTAGRAGAAPLVRDLGQGLVYCRVHELPADLSSVAPGGTQTPRVLDLRYVRGDRAAARPLEAWVGFNATLRTPVFLLANDHTSAALLEPLFHHPAVGLIVLGPSSAKEFEPDVAVKVSAEADRKAYDA